MLDKFFKDMHVLEGMDLGMVTKFLGMKVTYDTRNRYSPEKEQCIQQMIVPTGLELSNPA